MNKKIVLGYRIAALVIITLGLADTAGFFSGAVNWYVFFAYTIQSNVLVWLFFALLIVKTAATPACREKWAYGFYPVVSFTVSFAILITLLIFWAILVPISWGGGNLLKFSNLGVHLFCPLLMMGDRVLFYKKGTLKQRDPLAIAIFPYLYIAQSFTLGLTHSVYFSPLGIESYYIYPFLDFDAHGYYVFAYIFALTLFFLGLAYLCFALEKHLSNRPGGRAGGATGRGR